MYPARDPVSLTHVLSIFLMVYTLGHYDNCFSFLCGPRSWHFSKPCTTCWVCQNSRFCFSASLAPRVPIYRSLPFFDHTVRFFEGMFAFALPPSRRITLLVFVRKCFCGSQHGPCLLPLPMGFGVFLLVSMAFLHFPLSTRSE